MQEIASLVHQYGSGISHAIGTGSHDLDPRVGGITTLQAIELLRNDSRTKTIVLVSKPGDPRVADRVLQALAQTGKRAVAYLQGVDVVAPEGVQLVGNLEEAARIVTESASGEEAPQADAVPRLSLREGQQAIRGLFCGGTLCQEAAATIGEQAAHELIDFGDDRYTRGRAHPMIDPTLRNQAIVQAGADPRVAVLLLDVVLGLGSHPDPAAATAPAIREAIAAAAANGRELAVLAHIVGTDRDPQDLARQEATLRAAGVHLFDSNYRAARTAGQMLAGVAV
jgi:FdrA protein